MADSKTTLSSDIVLQMKGVSKQYPGTLAVDCVDFEVRRGEVHVLMGENGAGKSTLMKILAGSFNDYNGQIFINGCEVLLHSPRQAKLAGIEMIYQELSLAQPISIAENILMGRLAAKAGILDKHKIKNEAGKCLERVGLHLDPMLPVEILSQHEAQLVEIAKALGNNPSILVMDEPTSALSSLEVARLFNIIRQLKKEGITIIYISHHIWEVFEIADRVTVLRDGKKVNTSDISELNWDKLVEMMIGQPVAKTKIVRRMSPGKARLRVENFSRFGFFHNISFHIKQGEILGIAGLSGAGRSELARSICGIDTADTGSIFLDDKEITASNMSDFMRFGFAYLTEDRKFDGLAMDLNAQVNMLSAINAKRNSLLSIRESKNIFSSLSSGLKLYPVEPRRQVNQFSGGNQQKILLAKWLATSPEVCLLDEPTRGVDVGAKQIIHQAIAALADTGKCILLISSDLTELVNLADRVIVMCKGHLTREMEKSELSENSILLAANNPDGNCRV